MQRKRGLSLNHRAEKLSASETFVKKVALRSYENKTRAVSDPPTEKVKETKYIRQPKKLASEMSRFMWRFTFYRLVVDVDYFHRRNSCHSPC